MFFFNLSRSTKIILNY